MILQGFPWNQTICIRGTDHLDTPEGERVYENRYVIWGRIAWGKLREYEVYEDTQKTEALDRLPEVDREAPEVIYMLRHGDAEEGDGDDSARRLTTKGERQAVAAGRALAALGIEIDACLTSPKVRAAETARLACEPLSVAPEAADELAGRFDALALAAGRGECCSSATTPTSRPRSAA